ncbi:hypothetical protein [Thalassococcus sp. S3]|uniref:hypothetical protein n=1 Tax=Thalassococcus sp. S3 TaxID=2017482 RepID=UPI0010249382|nr:hypothetical protein [Thalassococcus sp. S3]QBF32826.1 hypothetical protein CFI11_16600 [Thalassococcus sp. S3]
MKNIALGLIAGIAAFLAVQYLVPTLFGNDRISVDDLVAEIKANDPSGFYTTVETHFPEDYARFVALMDETANNPNIPDDLLNQALFGRSQAFMSDLRLANAPYFARASIEQIETTLSSYLAFVQSLSSDPRFCNRILAFGTASLGLEESLKIDQALLSDTANQVFLTFAEGRAQMNDHGTATSADWDSVLAEWQADVAQPNFPSIYMAQDPGNEAYCEATISFYEALRDMDGESRDRVLIEVTSKVIDID